MILPAHAALIVIDMQNGFISPASTLCIAGAAETLTDCARVIDTARTIGMHVVHACREYAADGSNVESTRFETWLAGGKPLSPGCDPAVSAGFPPETAPRPGDRVIVKPRFSAFFDTPLHAELREAGVGTVVLIGTTTPNCIRSTCYDALSLDYNVVIVEDCTSSRTPEAQQANIEDMACVGAQIISADSFCAEGLANARDIVAAHRNRVAAGV